MAKKQARKKRTARSSGRAAAQKARSIPAWHTAWEKLPESVQHVVCVAFLVAVAFAFFAPIHVGGLQIQSTDITQFRGMAQSILDYQEAAGEPALWSTNPFGGMPAFKISYSKAIPQLDSITRFLRSVIWPSSHLILLFLGMYALVVFLVRDKLAGVMAACAIGFTTYIPVFLMAGHNSKFETLAFVPWLVLAFAYGMRHPKLLSGLLFAMAFALNLRAGHEQITYHTAFMLGIWWIVEGIVAARSGDLKRYGQATGWLFMGTVLGLLMIAQPLMATWEYKAYSIRGASSGGVSGGGGLAWDYAMAWSQGFGEMITLLIADAYGGGGLTYWGDKIFTGGPHYIGGLVLLLAAFAIWKVRKPEVWGLGAATLLMLLFALGENFEALNRLMFNYFPFFDAFRVPETWLLMVVFACVLLAVWGIRHITQPAASEEERVAQTKSVFIAVGAAVGLMVILLVMKDVFFDFERENEVQMLANRMAQGDTRVMPQAMQQAQQLVSTRIKPERIERFNQDAMRTLFALLVGGAALMAYRRQWIPAWLMKVVLVLVVLVDLWGVARRHFNADAPQLVAATRAENPIDRYPYDDFILAEREAAGGLGSFRTLSLMASLSENARPAYFYETLSGYHGAKLRRFQDYLDHILYDANGLPNQNALDLMNVRFVVAPVAFPGMDVVAQGTYGQNRDYVVSENTDVLPRAYFVGQTEVLSSAEETWARLQDPNFDLHTTALLPEAIDFEATPIDSTSTVAVEVQAYGPREIVWQVDTDAPRLLMVTDVYYSAGWHATLDGEPVPIHRANYLLRAVPIPAGEHTLVMRFDPPGHYRGMWVAGLSTAFVYGGVLVLLGLAWMRRRKAADASGEGEG